MPNGSLGTDAGWRPRPTVSRSRSRRPTWPMVRPTNKLLAGMTQSDTLRALSGPVVVERRPHWYWLYCAARRGVEGCKEWDAWIRRGMCMPKFRREPEANSEQWNPSRKSQNIRTRACKNKTWLVCRRVSTAGASAMLVSLAWETERFTADKSRQGDRARCPCQPVGCRLS